MAPRQENNTQKNHNNQVVISVVFALLGVGVGCPWNAFINARPYFESRFCGTSSASFAQNDIEVWFSVLFNVASVLSLVGLLALQYYCRRFRSLFSSITTSGCHHPLSPSLRASSSMRKVSNHINHCSMVTENMDYASLMVLIPLGLYLVVFLFTTLLVYFPEAPTVFVFYATLIGLFLCGVCMSVASAGIIGTASLFHAEGPYFQGQAFGGVAVALINGAAAWSQDPALYQQNVCQNMMSAAGHDEDDVLFTSSNSHIHSDSVCVPYTVVNNSTGAYFLLNCIILAACILGYIYVDKKKHELRLQMKDDYTPVLDVSEEWLEKFQAATAGDTTTPSMSRTSSSSLEVDGVPVNDEDEEAQSSIHILKPILPTEENGSLELSSSYQQHEHSIHIVWEAVKYPAIALFLTYTVTLAVFPVITSDLTSIQECLSNARFRNDMFVPLTFFTFNAGDLLGRFLVSDETAEKHRHSWPRKLVWASLLRLAFIPVFFLCFSRKSLYKDVAIHSDLFSWLVQFVMAVTNGVLTTVSFSVAASLIPMEENLQQIASSILNLSLCLGLVAGGLLASPVLFFFTGNW